MSKAVGSQGTDRHRDNRAEGGAQTRPTTEMSCQIKRAKVHSVSKQAGVGTTGEALRVEINQIPSLGGGCRATVTPDASYFSTVLRFPYFPITSSQLSTLSSLSFLRPFLFSEQSFP